MGRHECPREHMRAPHALVIVFLPRSLVPQTQAAACVNRLSLSLVRPLHRGCKNKSRTPSAAEKLLARRGRCFPGSVTVAPRAYWKGYLKLSLVSCPIALSPAASSSERISFRQINKKTGNRLRQQLVDEETREPVEAENKGRGYEIDKGVYIEVDDDELEAIQVESRHTIDIDSFVPATQIDKRFYDSPYYIAPTDSVGQEAFAVIREAMRGKGMVALGRIVLAKHERVIAGKPNGKGRHKRRKAASASKASGKCYCRSRAKKRCRGRLPRNPPRAAGRDDRPSIV